MSSKQEGSASLWNVPVPKVTESPGGSKDTSSSTAAASTNATQPASTADEQRTHREGIEHLKQNTAQPSHLESSAATGAADRNQPPSSNPSSQDPSGGISSGGVAAVGAGSAAAAAAGGAVAATAAHGDNQTHSQSSSLPQPPASNPADDASGGIGKGHGGVSTAAYTTSPVGEHDTTSAEQAGILGTVKSYLGLSQGGEAGVQQDTNLASADKKDNSGDSNTTTNDTNSGGGYVAGISAAVASTAAALTGSKQQQPATSEAASSSDAAASDKGTYLNYSGTSSSGATSSAPTSSLVDRTVETVKQYTTGTTNASSTTDPSANDNPSGSADPAKDNSTTSRNMGDTDEQPQHKSTPTDKAAATRENKDAIPTAGGERLGEKHWGESKIVPDNPKPAAEGAGVSSSEGQPNDETVANTAANTGGSTGPPGSSSTTADDHSASGGKPKTLDKIKDKLNIGSKKD